MTAMVSNDHNFGIKRGYMSLIANLEYIGQELIVIYT